MTFNGDRVDDEETTTSKRDTESDESTPSNEPFSNEDAVWPQDGSSHTPIASSMVNVASNTTKEGCTDSSVNKEDDAGSEGQCGTQAGEPDLDEMTSLPPSQAQLPAPALTALDSQSGSANDEQTGSKPEQVTRLGRNLPTDKECIDQRFVHGMRLGPDYSIVEIWSSMFQVRREEGVKSQYRLWKDDPAGLWPSYRMSDRDADYLYRHIHGTPLSLADGKPLILTEYHRNSVKVALPTEQITVFNQSARKGNLSLEEAHKRWSESEMTLKEYTDKRNKLQPDEYLHADRIPARYPSRPSSLEDEQGWTNWEDIEEYIPEVVFDTEFIPTGKHLKETDIPASFKKTGDTGS